MIKTVKINKYVQVRLVDTFRPAVIETNKKNKGEATTEVDIHFGAIMDVVIVVAKHKKLSSDDMRRIKILTDGHE